MKWFVNTKVHKSIIQFIMDVISILKFTIKTVIIDSFSTSITNIIFVWQYNSHRVEHVLKFQNIKYVF